MSQPPAPTRDSTDQTPETAGQAEHGYRNEVNWGSGEGRQPYSNQGSEETPSPAAAAQEVEGNRGDKSGRTVDQMEQVKRKP